MWSPIALGWFVCLILCNAVTGNLVANISHTKPFSCYIQWKLLHEIGMISRLFSDMFVSMNPSLVYCESSPDPDGTDLNTTPTSPEEQAENAASSDSSSCE